MNLVECPLSSVADRYLGGEKTVVFRDEAWDPDRRAMVKRELAISGSDRYGLPTAKDEDVLLACVQLSSMQDFREREVRFSRYELLKLLRWPDEGKSYRRLSVSLRRWKGVTVYSDRAFFDHARRSWVTRDFGVFDNLYVYEREASERPAAPASSWLVWNEVLYESFRAGYLKQLDWDLYCRLTDPVAKRLYRLLDKRFYHAPREVVFDLRELGVRKVRLSAAYDSAQMKRALTNGIRELEALWDLQPLPPERRFVRLRRGEWQVVFHRKRAARREAAEKAAPEGLVAALVTRGVTRPVAETLIAEHPPGQVEAACALFDGLANEKRPPGAGLLVDAVRNPEKYRPPEVVGRESPGDRPPGSRNRPKREFREPAGSKAQQRDAARWRAFTAFWDGLDETAREAFEAAALLAAAPTKRDGYRRLQAAGGPAFEAYRRAVLRDHFERG